MPSIAVPNHLETEDTFVFGLSMRQAVILFVGLCAASATYSDLLVIPRLGLVLGIVAATLLLLIAAALAFMTILGRALDGWCLVLLFYAARPRTYAWAFDQPDAFDQADLGRALREPDEGDDDEW